MYIPDQNKTEEVSAYIDIDVSILLMMLKLNFLIKMLSFLKEHLSGDFAINDIHEFRKALNMSGDPTLQDVAHKSIFEKALATDGCIEYVEEC